MWTWITVVSGIVFIVGLIYLLWQGIKLYRTGELK